TRHHQVLQSFPTRRSSDLNTSRTVVADGARLELTTMEYELLLLLASRPGRDFSRDEILAALRGIDAAILTRSVDILVSRLRARLGDTTRPGRWIHTVWGRGYRDRKSTRLNSSHVKISYAVFCLKKKK